jgi:hypothetical protein
MTSCRGASLVVVAVLLLIAPAADARTLALARAKAAAQAFLDRENGQFGMSPEHVTTCARRSAHVVDCRYKRGPTCGTVRVRLRSTGRTITRERGYPFHC